MKMKLHFIAAILLVIIVSPSVAIVTPSSLNVFGDSLFDVGNNNYLPAAPEANFPFNGIDYPQNISTGRFSNGYIGPDYLAMYMGYPQSPPPYLSITNDESQLLRGISFASGGSGIFNSTGAGTLSLATQVTYFQEAARNLSRRSGNLPFDVLLPNSLFYISSGSNDMFAYFFASGAKTKTANDQFIATLVNTFKLHLTRLYKLGARKMAILGTAQTGCIPFVRSLSLSGACSVELNNLSIQFKNETRALLQNLASRLPKLRYTFIDTYEIDSQIRANARQYGFTDLTNACCGTGRFNGEGPCTPISNLCRNRSDHYSWDPFHPVERLAKLVTEMAYLGTLNVSPTNIKQLINA